MMPLQDRAAVRRGFASSSYRFFYTQNIKQRRLDHTPTPDPQEFHQRRNMRRNAARRIRTTRDGSDAERLVENPVSWMM